MVAAVATPFFASSIGIIGVGAILGELAKCVAGALIEFGFAGLNYFFLKLIWSDELASFEPYANEYRMKLFMENQLKNGLNDLRRGLPADTWVQFRQTFTGMSAAPAA